jgi:hypothetical protein
MLLPLLPLLQLYVDAPFAVSVPDCPEQIIVDVTFAVTIVEFTITVLEFEA